MTPDIAALARKLSGPHEWGYRDPVEGGFIPDNAPFEAATALEALSARLEIPEAPFEAYDGIACRDETIRGLDAEVARLQDRIGEAYQLAGSLSFEHDHGEVLNFVPLLDKLAFAERKEGVRCDTSE